MLGDAVLSADGAQRAGVGADLSDLLGAQLRADTPAHVLGVRHGFEVCGVATRAVAAEVIDVEACGDRTVHKLVREAMGSHRFPADAELSVATARGVRMWPTGVRPPGPVDFCPQALFRIGPSAG